MKQWWYLVMFKHKDKAILAHPIGLEAPVKPTDLENIFIDVLTTTLNVSPEETTILAVSAIGTT